MNDLSWLIYAAGVAGNVQTLLGFSAGIACLAYGAWAFGATIEDKAAPPFRLIVAAGAMALVATIIPGSNTIYLIAASEAGEAVATTPQAQALLSDVQTLIQRELDDMLRGTDD